MNRFQRAVATILFAMLLTFSAAAAEPPRSFLGRIAVKSTSLLLERLDEFLAAATKGRKNALPPGSIGMLAALSLPLSLENIDLESPAQFLIFFEAGTHPDAVALLPMKDFSAFIEDLSGRTELKRFEGETPFRSLHFGRGLTIAELDDGKAAIYSSPSLAREMADLSWAPEYNGEALIFAEFAPHPENRALAGIRGEILRECFEENLSEFAKKMRKLHIGETVANGMEELAREYAPGLIEELPFLKNARLLLDFDAEKLTLRLETPTGENSFFGRAAARLEAAGKVDAGVMTRLPVGFMTVGAVAVPDALLSLDEAKRMTGILFSRLFPELLDDALAMAERGYGAFGGKNAAASFLTADGRQISLAMYYPEDPSAALAIFRESAALQNRVFGQTIDQEEYRFRFAENPSSGAEGFTEFRLEFSDPALMRRIIAEFSRKSKIELDPSLFENLRVYVGIRDGALLVLSGPALDSDVRDILALLDAGNPALADGLRARDALDWLDGAQAGLFLIAADAIMPLVVQQAANAQQALLEQQPIPGLADNNLFAAIRDRAIPLFAKKGETMGYALGADDGVLSVRGYVPAEAVNSLLHDHEVYERVRTEAFREMFGKKESDGEEADSYDYEEEYEDGYYREEEPGEQDMMLDGPAGAS